MKKNLLYMAVLTALASTPLSTQAINDNTVEVVFNGTSATVTIADNISSWGGKAVKADGTVANNGGTWVGFTSSDVSENNASTGIGAVRTDGVAADGTVFDLQGRPVPAMRPGVYVVKSSQGVRKVCVR